MQNPFQVFCHEAERAIAGVLANERHSFIRLAREHDARWHPNGFLVFELGPLMPGFLRLHVWPTGSRHTRGSNPHLHTHVWDLYSRVLAGRYTEQIYEVAAAGSIGAREFQMARIDYLRDRNSLREPTVGYLRPRQTVTAVAGDCHAVRAGDVHETLIPSDNYVATLLIVSPPRLNEAHIYSLDPLPAPEHNRLALSREDRNTVLDDLELRLSREATP